MLGSFKANFISSYGGWAGEAFDFQLFALALPLILATQSLTPAMAGLAVTGGLVAAAIGGSAGGALSDRIGRLSVLQGAIMVTALATLGFAVAVAPWQFVVLKAIQGLAFGAEWSVGAVLIAERASAGRRGRYLGLMQSAWAIGWGAAVLTAYVASSLFDPAVAWRIMFAAGVAPVGLVLWLRLQPRQEQPRKARPSRLAPQDWAAMKRRVLPSALLGLAAHGGFHSLFTWVPTLLRTERGFSVGQSTLILLTMTAAFGLGCIAAGVASDRFGRRTILSLFAALSATTAFTTTLLPLTPVTAVAAAVPLGFAAGGVPAILGCWFAELFPAPVRGLGVGFAYNAGRIGSAALPGLIGWAMGLAPLGVLIGMTALICYGGAALVAQRLPETRSLEMVAP
ncbi:MFS transporter [Brevundimonas sp.]|uniref:MFS transporter n=1 Tax=Brevundimonas sp. TaxID=1871086 RepID=UPI0037C061AB